MALAKSKGNMYFWVSHTHSHLGGRCGHDCKYCYIDSPRWGRHERYEGKIRLIEKEFSVNYGRGKTIFIEHMNDLFAEEVPQDMIDKILEHCCEWQGNTYVFQSKNPKRMADNVDNMPESIILGCTIETNREISDVSNAPTPMARAEAMMQIREDFDIELFVTVEPVLEFDVKELSIMLIDIKPDFLNIGADSKNHELEEPEYSKILELVDVLNENNITVNTKSNMSRLSKGN